MTAISFCQQPTIGILEHTFIILKINKQLSNFEEQRHMFHISDSMSSSEGLLFDFSMADAIIICPTWQ